MASSTPALHQTPDSSGVPEWLRWAGFRFDPFGPLDAAADPHLSEYLVGHEVFARVWGDGISWVFAPAGGGKTALRISVMQACWIGQETNRPFPIPYVPPFLAWGACASIGRRAPCSHSQSRRHCAFSDYGLSSSLVFPYG
jgi:hypothetical protein